MSKRGLNIYKRKDGRWEGRYFTGKRKNGRKCYASVYGSGYFETRRKLVDTAANIEPAGVLTFTACAEEWLSDAEFRVKPSTFANYRFLLQRHILPHLNHRTMQKLSNPDIESFITEKLSCGKLKQKSGLSRKYLKDIVSVIKQIAAYAERKYGIPNKIRYTVSPKPPRRELYTLSFSDKQKLTKHLGGRNMDLGILLSLYTGMRIGEVCGLKWGDIDLNENVITVCRTVQRICDGSGSTYLIAGEPKTNTSHRTIPIPNALKAAFADKSSDSKNTVISNSEKFIEPHALRKYFYSVLMRCGIPHCTYHTLRHSFASECVRLGFDIKALSEILGHANASMTLDRYAHTTLETKRMYMERIA